MDQSRPKITILASGSGSNAENIIRFSTTPEARYSVASVLCNRRDAFVLERAARLGIPHHCFTAKEFRENTIRIENEEMKFTDYLKRNDIGYIILAGFLLKVPDYLIEIYPEKILNIHPALLPSYGGKGMYGEHVHRAVIAAKEKRSGITIHLADRHYDHGRIVYQAECEITEGETPESLAAKIHSLESIYPAIINTYISETNTNIR